MLAHCTLRNLNRTMGILWYRVMNINYYVIRALMSLKNGSTLKTPAGIRNSMEIIHEAVGNILINALVATYVVALGYAFQAGRDWRRRHQREADEKRLAEQASAIYQELCELEAARKTLKKKKV